MKIIKIRASDLYKNSNKDIQVNEKRFGYLYCLKVVESAYMYTHAHTCARMRICTFGNTPNPPPPKKLAALGSPPLNIEKLPTPM